MSFYTQLMETPLFFGAIPLPYSMMCYYTECCFTGGSRSGGGTGVWCIAYPISIIIYQSDVEKAAIGIAIKNDVKADDF